MPSTHTERAYEFQNHCGWTIICSHFALKKNWRMKWSFYLCPSSCLPRSAPWSSPWFLLCSISTKKQFFTITPTKTHTSYFWSSKLSAWSLDFLIQDSYLIVFGITFIILCNSISEWYLIWLLKKISELFLSSSFNWWGCDQINSG